MFLRVSRLAHLSTVDREVQALREVMAMTHDPRALAAAARRLEALHIYQARGVWVAQHQDQPNRIIGSDWDLIGALLETMPLPYLYSTVTDSDMYWVCDSQWLQEDAPYGVGPPPLDAVLACCLAMEGET